MSWTNKANAIDYSPTVQPITRALYEGSDIKKLVDNSPKNAKMVVGSALWGLKTYRQRALALNYKLTENTKSRIMVGAHEINYSITFPFSTK